MTTTSGQLKRRARWETMGAIAGAMLTMSAGTVASAQNLLKNSSFERSSAFIDFNDLLIGRTTLFGPDSSLAPWFVPAGTDVEHYFRRLDGSRSIARVPHGDCVIGLDYPSGNQALGAIQQGFATPYPTNLVAFYAMVGDFAGDRGKGAPRTASFGSSLALQNNPIVTKWDYFPTPALAGPNTTENSVFMPRVLQYPATGAVMSGVFNLWDNDDLGVLADAVHLFPVHIDDTLCGDWRRISGFSILEDGTWSASTPTDPWQDLKSGTPSGCSCSTDNKFLSLSNGLGGASTMLISAWDQYAGGTRSTLKLTLEIQSVSGYCPQATVSFYDFNSKRWTSPFMTMAKLPPYPGYKIKPGVRCYTIDWASLDIREPAPNTNKKTSLLSYVEPTRGMVLARVIFANGNASWINGPTTWPPTYTPPSPWTIRVHAAGIDCK